ncbi:ABC transporter substrate-binding protein [Halorientalis sp.]|uniref:ABC transporter substrate-binding protein n=1 Tax=Halorientalis sp. TaxID=1931229 RepID=UPI0026256DA4|nr:ABC transporter substrate-binding protein [Halorientalis sp.]
MDTVTLGLEWFLNPDHIPFVVADERGYYEDEDLELDIWEPPEHYDTLEMLAEGELDYAITEPIHLVPERSEGVPVTSIATFLHTRGGIQYPADRGWESPADLEPGVRLNYPGAPGPGGRKMVAYMARQAGGDLTAADIEPVDRGFYHTDALVDGDADVAFLAFYNFEIVESRHRGFEADLWELADYGVPDFNQLVLTAADRKVETAPDEVQRFIDATRRGVEDTVEDGEAAVELFFEQYPGVREESPELMDETAAATREFFTPELTQDIEMYRDLVTFCEELDLSEGPVDADAFTDERFVE